MNLRSLFLAITLLSSCSDADEPKPSYLDPPTYQTLHAKTHGAYFQFRSDGKFYLGCSIHQGAAANGAKIFRAGQETPVIMGKRVHRQHDLHLWEYDRSTLPDADALNFFKNVEIKKGDRIYILNKGQKLAATVAAVPRGSGFRYSYKTDKPFRAGGMSGSPIFLPRTGSVIGVLQTANSKTAATFGGFEKHPSGIISLPRFPSHFPAPHAPRLHSLSSLPPRSRY